MIKESMQKKKNIEPGKIALISAPWPIYNKPSIQLGVLKASLMKSFPDLSADSYHFYLNIAEKTGYKIYHEISEKSWLAESVYAALLYPEKKEDIKKLFNKESSSCSAVKETGFDEVIRIIKKTSDELINSIDWQSYMFAGFSICLCQLTSSIYFIDRIKTKFPEVPIVVGGSLFSGLNPDEIFNAFNKVDFLINGEGEQPLNELTKQFVDKKNVSEIKAVPGLIVNDKSDSNTNNRAESFCQTKKLDNLPVPDFDDYFKTLEKLPVSKRFFPTLPVEMSRGCWWERKSKYDLRGCAFCNLNLQWKGYRAKSPERIKKEIDYLSSKYKTLSITFMDNLIPFKNCDEIFKSIKELNKDFSFFCEIRANTTRDNLITMKNAGVRYVQVGIESLSSNLLFKINKGTTAIENMEIMKNCEATGVINKSNLILYFPKSNEEDVAETLKAIEYAEIFRPLTTVRFQLGLGSPVMKSHKTFNIKSVFNHKNYNYLFPKHITRSVTFLNQSYKGDLGFQKKLWGPVKKRILEWEKSYNKLHESPNSVPILTFRDGKDFLIIRKRKEDGEHDTHRLTGASRKIYLFCEKNRTFKEIKNKFPKLSGQSIFSFLSMMADKKLIFEDNDRYLSLAVKISFEVSYD